MGRSHAANYKRELHAKDGKAQVPSTTELLPTPGLFSQVSMEESELLSL